jgi:hypothetical protein
MSSHAFPHRRPALVVVLVAALTGFAGTFVPVASQAAVTGRALDFAPAFQTTTQLARLTLVNLPDQKAGIPPGPCAGAVEFYDLAGNLLGGKSMAFSLAPGAGAVFVAPTGGGLGGSVSIRGRATYAAKPATGLDACGGMNASWEVYDAQTLETKFMNPGVIRGFNPQPDPPAGIDAGQ